jgi:uncharacterized Zn finger protein
MRKKMKIKEETKPNYLLVCECQECGKVTIPELKTLDNGML